MKRVLPSYQQPLYNNLEVEDMQMDNNMQAPTFHQARSYCSSMMSATKRRKVQEEGREDFMNMDIGDMKEENMQEMSYSGNNLLELPTEMLAHVFSFLPLKDLCHSAEICSTTYSIVRSYTLLVCYCICCYLFICLFIFSLHSHFKVCFLFTHS